MLAQGAWFASERNTFFFDLSNITHIAALHSWRYSLTACNADKANLDPQNEIRPAMVEYAWEVQGARV